jgi:hypothetical protein
MPIKTDDPLRGSFTRDVAVADETGCFPADNWALKQCGFKEGSAAMDRGDDPGPIAVIDVGSGGFDDRCLSRVTRKPATDDGLSTAIHAAEVAGVIVSACSAKIEVYNVARTTGLDTQLILEALNTVRDSRAKVLNLSIGWQADEDKLNAAVAACIKAGIVVVAAMGDHKDPEDVVSYPAAVPGVIAVGATDRHDRRLATSPTGNDIWIAAPGEDIPTIGSAEQQGTSFATALVSAGAWLKVRASGFGTADIRRVLATSADATLVGLCPEELRDQINTPTGRWNPALGCGRLDVAKLATAV